MKLTDGVYGYIWNAVFENNCNMYYFAEPLNLLFDPGLGKYMDVRFMDMKNDGLDPEKIGLQVLTHCHPDHFEAVPGLIEKGIGAAMHREEIDYYNEQGPRVFQMMGVPFPDIAFETVLEEGPWEVNGVALEVYHTPGHSPGSVCIYWPEKKALVCGDLIFDRSFGRFDLPGGDVKKLQESIKKISELEIEFLLPGHMNYIQGRDMVKRNFSLIIDYFAGM